MINIKTVNIISEVLWLVFTKIYTHGNFLLHVYMVPSSSTCFETVADFVGQVVEQQEPVDVLTLLRGQVVPEVVSQRCPYSHEIRNSYSILHNLTHVTGSEYKFKQSAKN